MAIDSVDVLQVIMNKLQMLEDSNRELREQLNEKLTAVAKENERLSSEIKRLWKRLNLEVVTENTSATNRRELPHNEGKEEIGREGQQGAPIVKEQEEEEDEAVRTYVFNLPREIGILVIPSQPRTLTKVQIRASDMELWTREANKNTERKTSFSRPVPTQQNSRSPPHHDTPLSERIKMKCFKCNKIGHTANDCFARNFPLGQHWELPPSRMNMTTEEP